MNFILVILVIRDGDNGNISFNDGNVGIMPSYKFL